tara:strand:+ start:5107 stop:5346 length:240 start_codon:yes stop_codon:yes gene_type:complete
MDCWHCNTELIWGGDHTYEDYDMEGEGVVSNLSCPNCKSFVEVYLPFPLKKKTTCNICHNRVYKVCVCKPVVNKRSDNE